MMLYSLQSEIKDLEVVLFFSPLVAILGILCFSKKNPQLLLIFVYHNFLEQVTYETLFMAPLFTNQTCTEYVIREINSAYHGGRPLPTHGSLDNRTVC